MKDENEEMAKEKEDLIGKDAMNVEEDTRKEKDESTSKEETRKEKDESTSKDTMLSFLHATKLEANSSLQGDSWMYNELMNLKGKWERCSRTRQLIEQRSFS